MSSLLNTVTGATTGTTNTTNTTGSGSTSSTNGTTGTTPNTNSTGGVTVTTPTTATTVVTSANSLIDASNTDLVVLFAVLTFVTSNYINGMGGSVLYKIVNSLPLTSDQESSLESYLNYLSEIVQGTKLDKDTLSNIISRLDTQINNIS